jgi:hypothetical protein
MVWPRNRRNQARFSNQAERFHYCTILVQVTSNFAKAIQARFKPGTGKTSTETRTTRKSLKKYAVAVDPQDTKQCFL